MLLLFLLRVLLLLALLQSATPQSCQQNSNAIPSPMHSNKPEMIHRLESIQLLVSTGSRMKSQAISHLQFNFYQLFIYLPIQIQTV